MVVVNLKNEDNLQEVEEVKVLNTFRAFMLEAAEEAASTLLKDLGDFYPNLDVQMFIDYVEDAIYDFTYDAMNETEEDDVDDEGNICDDC